MNKQQLASRIWASANEMRSKIEASEYKDYILGFIFYKFLSQKEEEWLREKGLEEADMPTITEDDPDVVEFVRPNLGYWPWFEEGHPETYEPLFVDAVVSNPPYSQRWDAPDGPDPRFDDYGIAPKSKADYAFLLHDLYHLQPDGIMCIVLPHGVLFRGGEEGKIRRNLIENDKIDAIIGLPANIFFGTGIPTIIMVLRKQRTRDDILIIDASKDFVKEGKNNKLRASDIRRIVDTYVARKDVDRFCRVVSKDDVRANDYNLNIPRYVDSTEQMQGWDIYAAMFGGIPAAEVDALQRYWYAFPGLRDELFEQVNPASMRLKVKNVEEAIRASHSVKQWTCDFGECFLDFEAWLYEELVDDFSLVPRNAEERQLTAELFGRLKGVPLIDRYDAYQSLDDDWKQIAVDLEVLQTEGFDAVRRVDPRMVMKKQRGRDVEVQALSAKYETTYADIDEQIREAEAELVGMLGQLTGNEYDMAGIRELTHLLGGDAR